MNSEEMREKGVNILRKFNTIESIEWLLENDWKLIDVEKKIKKKKEFKVEKGIIIKKESKKYELYYLNERTFPTHDDYATMGDFHLYYNDSLVINTNYSKNYDEWGSGIKISWNSSGIEILKLSEWVEEIPEIYKHQKKLIDLKEKKEKEKFKKKFDKETKKNFDLGKFS